MFEYYTNSLWFEYLSRALFFDVSVGGEGVHIKSRNEEFPKRPLSEFSTIKNSSVFEKKKKK